MVDETDKALISLGVLVGAAIISGIIAKIVDICYDRASIRDDASDVSEHTRNLIRARLTVMKFRKKGNNDVKTPLETETEKKDNAVKVFRIWSAKSRVRAHPGTSDKSNNQNGDDKIEVEDVAERVDEESKITKGAANNDSVESTEKVVTVDETVQFASSPDVKRPKSALKKPKPTVEEANSGSAVEGSSGTRPKSAVKRVTIAEPEGTPTGTPGTEDGQKTPGKASPRGSSPGNSTAPPSAESTAKSQSDKQVDTTPPGQSSTQRSERTDQDGRGGGDPTGAEVGVIRAWEEGKSAQGGDEASASSPGRPTPKGKLSWKSTYVLYRGSSDDHLLKPFTTKSKPKPKPKFKKRDGKKPLPAKK